MTPLICVLTVTVASGVTVPSAGMRTWMSPDAAVATDTATGPFCPPRPRPRRRRSAACGGGKRRIQSATPTTRTVTSKRDPMPDDEGHGTARRRVGFGDLLVRLSLIHHYATTAAAHAEDVGRARDYNQIIRRTTTSQYRMQPPAAIAHCSSTGCEQLGRKCAMGRGGRDSADRNAAFRPKELR